MSSELLRIHDENNNCDLVAVANPMGNFHMSTYAEMQDGTQKPVDGWYLFSKMIEKLGQGGGGAETIVFTADSDESYAQLNDGKKASDIGAAFENNIGRVFIENDDVLYLVMANPATYNGNFAMSPDYALTSSADPDVISFNKIGY